MPDKDPKKVISLAKKRQQRRKRELEKKAKLAYHYFQVFDETMKGFLAQLDQQLSVLENIVTIEGGNPAYKHLNIPLEVLEKHASDVRRAREMYITLKVRLGDLEDYAVVAVEGMLSALIKAPEPGDSD